MSSFLFLESMATLIECSLMHEKSKLIFVYHTKIKMTEMLVEIIVCLTEENITLKAELAAEKNQVIAVKNDLDVKTKTYHEELDINLNRIKSLEEKYDYLNTVNNTR